jgi:hypothetical protein
MLCDDIDRDIYLKELMDRPYERYQYHCIHCHKGFAAKNNCYRHQKTCLVVDRNINNQSIQKEADIVELSDIRKQIHDLQKRLQDIETNTRSCSNNNHNATISGDVVIVNGDRNTTMMNSSITILNIGEERMNHINETNMVNKYFLGIDIPKLVRDIHFNESIPENMNIRYQSNDEFPHYVERRINNKWMKTDVETAISQLIISKSKLLELVPRFREISKQCDAMEVDNILKILQEIKRNALDKIEDDLFFTIRYRLQKEEQKSRQRDTNSNLPYCFQSSPLSSECVSETEHAD